jgi:O-antigen/teichoic acid export membrane protein
VSIFQKIKEKIKSTTLLKHTFIFFLGTTVVNIGNYLFNTIAGRMLEPAHFGVFNSAMSILYIITIATGAFNLAIVKFASELTREEHKTELHSLFKQVSQKSFLWGATVSLIIILLSPFIKNFLKLESLVPIVIAALTALFSFTIIVNRAFLQAKLKFKSLSINLILEVIIKILVTIGLIMLGIKYNAPLLGFLGAIILAYLLSFYSVNKKIFSSKKDSLRLQTEFKFSKIIKFLFPTLVSIAGLTIFYSMDVILVKHFFTSEEAGLYSVLSLIGKIIFFSTAAVGSIIFPMAAKNHKENKPHSYLLKQSAFIALAISAIATLIYFIFPDLIIKILFGERYLPISPYLGFFGIIFSILSLSNIFTNYYLSLDKKKIIFTPLVSSVLMIILICFLHESLKQITISLLTSSGLMLIVFLFYTFSTYKKARQPINNT